MSHHTNPEPSDRCRLKRGFTLIELLVSIAVVAVLAGVIFAGFKVARSNSRSSVCINNLRQLSFGFAAYAADNEGLYPDHLYKGVYWPEKIEAYVPRKTFFCPEAVEKEGLQKTLATIDTNKVWKDSVTRVSYGHNGRGLSPNFGSTFSVPNAPRKVTNTVVGRLSSIIVLADAGRVNADSTGGWGFYYMEPPYFRYSLPLPRHKNKANLLWADGHVSQRECILDSTDSKVTEKLYPLREWYYTQQ